VPKIIKVGENLTKLWEKQFWQFFLWNTEYYEASLLRWMHHCSISRKAQFLSRA